MALNAQYSNSSDDKLIQEKLYNNNCNTTKLTSSYNQKPENTRPRKKRSKNYHNFQLKLEHTKTKINSQHSQQQIERHVFEFMKLIITI
jgi:hypothetical protein